VGSIRGETTRIIDSALDLGIVPGFSSIGYGLRRRIYGWEDGRLEGRSVMVTGANAGIGRAMAEGLAGAGATVHMVCRNPARGEEAREAIALDTGTEPHLHQCDLSSLASVKGFAEGFLASGEPLDVLVNNAGVMPPERRMTDEGFELTFATNVLGPFLLTALLLPRISQSDEGRVVMMSSGGMYSTGFSLRDPELEASEYDPPAVYAHTKRAEVMLADEFNRRTGGDPAVCSMHPGWAATGGVSDALPTFNRVMGPILRSPEAGADTAVWLSGASLTEAPGGLFYMDRRPRPKYRVPGTRETATDRAGLFELCEEMTGFEGAADTD
jgi:dehydrogenase/reductase SDR family protein 12